MPSPIFLSSPAIFRPWNVNLQVWIFNFMALLLNHVSCLTLLLPSLSNAPKHQGPLYPEMRIQANTTRCIGLAYCMYNQLHRSGVWHAVARRFHEGSGDLTSKSPIFLEIMLQITRIWNTEPNIQIKLKK